MAVLSVRFKRSVIEVSWVFLRRHQLGRLASGLAVQRVPAHRNAKRQGEQGSGHGNDRLLTMFTDYVIHLAIALDLVCVIGCWSRSAQGSDSSLMRPYFRGRL